MIKEVQDSLEKCLILGLGQRKIISENKEALRTHVPAEQLIDICIVSTFVCVCVCVCIHSVLLGI